jgi:hypothetical protein
MESLSLELRQLVKDFSRRFESLPENEFAYKPLPNKWSKKEVLGHLIDSAHNNLRRFICTQYEITPPKIFYDQDFWVKANAYQIIPKEDIISLWCFMNERIAGVWTAMPKENYLKECDTGKQSVQLRSIFWLAEDYIKHMKHHLNQIFAESFDIIYRS